MKRIIWCCFPVTVFSGGVVFLMVQAVKGWREFTAMALTVPQEYQYAIRSTRWAVASPLFIATGLLILWAARLALAVHEYRRKQ